MSEWFIVKDVDALVESARALVYNNFGTWETSEDDTPVDEMLIKPEEKEEFDKLLSPEESKVIVTQILKKQKHKTTQKLRYLVSDDLFISIIQILNDRMVSNTLANLVSKGLVESAYDSELDDFIFWVKDEEKPETD